MSCPTCTHTMTPLGVVDGNFKYFWCPRCGTIRAVLMNQKEQDSVPKLVERCRQFRAKVLNTMDVPGRVFRLEEWRRLGIAESINVPEERPT